MKLKDTLTLLKAGYTRDEIRAFDNEEPESTGEAAPDLMQAVSVLSDKVLELQAAIIKQTPAAEPAKDDVNAILAKLQSGTLNKEE